MHATALPVSTDQPMVPPRPEARGLTLPQPFHLLSEVRTGLVCTVMSWGMPARMRFAAVNLWVLVLHQCKVACDGVSSQLGLQFNTLRFVGVCLSMGFGLSA